MKHNYLRILRIAVSLLLCATLGTLWYYFGCEAMLLGIVVEACTGAFLGSLFTEES